MANATPTATPESLINAEKKSKTKQMIIFLNFNLTTQGLCN